MLRQVSGVVHYLPEGSATWIPRQPQQLLRDLPVTGNTKFLKDAETQMVNDVCKAVDGIDEAFRQRDNQKFMDDANIKADMDSSKSRIEWLRKKLRRLFWISRTG